LYFAFTLTWINKQYLFVPLFHFRYSFISLLFQHDLEGLILKPKALLLEGVSILRGRGAHVLSFQSLWELYENYVYWKSTSL